MSPATGQPSLGRKITVACYAIALLVIVMAALTFFELASIEKKVSLGERSSELLEVALEIRRFERNYFLHHQATDYEDNRGQIARAWILLDDHQADFVEVGGAEKLRRLQILLDVYRKHMTGYAVAVMRNGDIGAAEAEVRAAGRDIVAIAGEMSAAEKDVLRAALSGFRALLVAAIALLAILILVMSRAVARRVVAPLESMEAGVDAVRGGRTALLQAPTADREIVAITDAVNHLLQELELRRQHLVRAEKLAAMGTLLSGVAHELNNPLSNISTSCQILLEEWDGTDAETRRSLLAQIDGQGERARNIVRTLLDFARPQDFRHERLPLQPLLEQTVALVRGEVTAEVAISCVVDGDLAVTGDAQRLQQALLNLVRNAVQAAAEQGRVSITARAARIGGAAAGDQALFPGCRLEGEVVDVAIADNGKGIAADVLPRIFDPFFTTKEVGQGMGLGLFITHEIIGEHDGCIAIDSSAAGTTFHVRLPAAPAETAP